MPSALIAMQESSPKMADQFVANCAKDCVVTATAGGGKPIVCGGCGQRICDRYYLLAVDRQWHCRCLRCHHCGQQLESELTCFCRHGLIYCKQDYHRLFCWHKCVRCQEAISPGELVMRLCADGHTGQDSHYYHTGCFTCLVCERRLIKGDYFGRHNNHIYCSYHYQQLIDSDCQTEANPPEDQSASAGTPDSDPLDDKKSLKSIDDSYQQKPKVYKKRKTSKLCQKFIDKLSALSQSSPGSRCESPMTPPDLLAYPGMKRPKRNRTSFKHQQLRTMKQYFNLNHNPDSKDLKQLSQRTGLPKRVLQVWFQNQRAKWRRSLLRQQSLGPHVVEECQPLTELNEYPIHADEEQTIVEEEQQFATYTNLY